MLACLLIFACLWCISAACLPIRLPFCCSLFVRLPVCLSACIQFFLFDFHCLCWILSSLAGFLALGLFAFALILLLLLCLILLLLFCFFVVLCCCSIAFATLSLFAFAALLSLCSFFACAFFRFCFLFFCPCLGVLLFFVHFQIRVFYIGCRVCICLVFVHAFFHAFLLYMYKKPKKCLNASSATDVLLSKRAACSFSLKFFFLSTMIHDSVFLQGKKNNKKQSQKKQFQKKVLGSFVPSADQLYEVGGAGGWEEFLFTVFPFCFLKSFRKDFLQKKKFFAKKSKYQSSLLKEITLHHLDPGTLSQYRDMKIKQKELNAG